MGESSASHDYVTWFAVVLARLGSPPSLIACSRTLSEDGHTKYILRRLRAGDGASSSMTSWVTFRGAVDSRLCDLYVFQSMMEEPFSLNSMSSGMKY